MKLRNMESGPSPHLAWKEFDCKDGTLYPKKFILDGRVFRLANVFESIRAIWNKPILIHSAYRSPEHNRTVGGARNSQHLQGRALDLAPPAGVKLITFYTIIRENTEEWGIHGLGKYKTFVHVDIRPTDKLITWSGSGVKDSSIQV